MGLKHGNTDICINGDIVVVTLSGSFNEFDAQDLTDKLKTTIDRFNGKPFCMLINNLKLEGLTPDAYEVIENYNEWLNGQNMKAKAFVSNSPLQIKLDNHNIPSKHFQNTQQFKTLTSALEWLQSQKH